MKSCPDTALQEALALAQKLGVRALCRDSARIFGHALSARGDAADVREAFAPAAANALIAQSLPDPALREVLERTYAVEGV